MTTKNGTSRTIVSGGIEIKVDKDVEMPLARHAKHRWRAAFEALEPGESFQWPEPSVKMSRVGSTATYYGKLFSRKYAVRKVPEGYRVWRIE